MCEKRGTERNSSPPTHTHREPREADGPRTDRQEPADEGARESEGERTLVRLSLALRRPRHQMAGKPSETRAVKLAKLRQGRNRPSTGRGPGSDPGPPCAFETSMIKVSCNSH